MFVNPMLYLSFFLLATVSVDPGIEARLASGAKPRVLVALRDVQQTDALLAALDPDHYRLVARFETVPAVILDVVSGSVVSAIASHDSVSGIELDSGGFGVFVGPEPVQKVARVAILDTGLPDVERLNGAEKLAGEQCFCRTASGAGCCPDGSVRQEGLGSTRESLPFETSSLAWLQIPNEPLRDFRRYMTWDPFISAYKVIPRGDAFDSWESVFRAVDAIEATAETQRHDVVLFSLASAKLYLHDCDRGGSALEWIWRSILRRLSGKQIQVLLAAARGGPGPGMALPACLASIPEFSQVAAFERYPVPGTWAALSSGGIGQPGGVSGPPPAPVARNASVGYGSVEGIRPALPEETPAVDTPQGQTFTVVRVRVRNASAARQDLASLLESGRSVDFLTLEVPGFAIGTDVKFSTVLTGFEGRSAWYAEAWRPVIVNSPQENP